MGRDAQESAIPDADRVAGDKEKDSVRAGASLAHGRVTEIAEEKSREMI